MLSTSASLVAPDDIHAMFRTGFEALGPILKRKKRLKGGIVSIVAGSPDRGCDGEGKRWGLIAGM